MIVTPVCNIKRQHFDKIVKLSKATAQIIKIRNSAAVPIAVSA